MKKQLLFLVSLFFAAATMAQAQVAPPSIASITPSGARRGTTVVFTVNGINLGGASEVLWSKPGIASRITSNAEQPREKPRLAEGQTGALIIDKATINRLTIEATIAPDAPLGFYGYRLKTPLGTTNMGRIVIGALPETMERETNDSLAEAQEVTLPTTIVGEMRSMGDADHFKFTAKAGQQVVFEVVAAALGSRLDSVLTLTDAGGKELASNNDFDGRRDSLLGYTFQHDGEYVIRITDLEHQGRAGQYGYRLNVGEFPYVTSAFPLGVKQGTTSEVAVTGFNLGAGRVKLTAPASAAWDETTLLRLNSAPGESLNAVRVAVGRYPEIVENGTNNSFSTAQPVALPVTINGKIWDGATGQGNNGATGREDVSSSHFAPSPRRPVAPSLPRPVEDYYRFTARQGQHLILEVAAQRLGSPLDSIIEVFDAKGQPVPRATLRCLLETSVTLNDPDSVRRGIRILSWNGIQPEDYLLIGNELLQVDVLPKTPDEDMLFKGFGGQRIGFEDTTPETHAVNTPVYKVSIHPPGTHFPSNGLPVVTLYYRNDDGGPMYGKDSRLNFTAPADGEYVVRIRDVRGLASERFAYRLTVREPAPDFMLAVDPENPNVPKAGQLPINVTASRIDGFDGDIEVKLLGLPAGFAATTGLIPAGQVSTVILLSAASTASGSFPLRVQGVAQVGGQKLAREFKTEERISLASVAPPAELAVWSDPPRVVIEPGGQASVTVKITRLRGFGGRVPIEVRNLPPGVIVKDVGLNGVLITEKETTQKFLLDVQPWVRKLEQPIFVVGRIETTSPQRSEFPAQPIILSIQPKEHAASVERH